jgi:hypothetical protein
MYKKSLRIAENILCAVLPLIVFLDHFIAMRRDDDGFFSCIYIIVFGGMLAWLVYMGQKVWFGHWKVTKE